MGRVLLKRVSVFAKLGIRNSDAKIEFFKEILLLSVIN